MEGAQGPAELTPRALASGLVVGAVLCLANLYMGLKTGFWDTGQVTASVLAFALCSGRLSVLENNTAQTAAAATGSAPAALGLLGSLPALELLGRHFPAPALVAWGFVMSTLGILFAGALRDRLVEQEKLPFPTGVATTEVIEALHSGEVAARQRTRPLLAGAAIGVIVGWFRNGRPALVPSTLAAPGSAFGVPLSTFGAGVATSPMLIGVGMVVGVHVALSILLGSALAWGVIAPAMVRGPIHLAADPAAISNWLSWPGTALLIGASLFTLLQQARSVPGALRALGSVARGRSRLRRSSVGAWGAALVATIALSRVVFGLSIPLSVIGLALLVVGTSLCARSTGLTDVTPLGAVGQATQALVAGLTPAQPVANIVAGSIVAGGATHTSTLLTSMAVGRKLGASPRAQVISAVAGAALGSVVCVPAYVFLVRAHGLASPALPVPTGLQWKAMGEVVASGLSALPPGAPVAAAVAAGIGFALAVLNTSRAARWVPSAFAVGIGVLVPIDYSLTIVCGAILARGVRPLRGRAEVLGAGLIAGESVVGVLAALLTSFGVL